MTILSRADTQDEYGNALDDWNEDFTCWADIVPVTGREYFSAEQSVSETQYKVYIRYRDSITIMGPLSRPLKKYLSVS
ncbi:phage head closure protein [Anaerovibrio lipolyticus]|nr:phage head closure protein [Anaerovibrio lipolyticus]